MFAAARGEDRDDVRDPGVADVGDVGVHPAAHGAGPGGAADNGGDAVAARSDLVNAFYDGGAGDDRIVASSGTDTMTGGPGRPRRIRLNAKVGRDQIVAGPGDDHIDTNPSADVRCGDRIDVRETTLYPTRLWRAPRRLRVLGITITRAGFEWALKHACLADYKPELVEPLLISMP